MVKKERDYITEEIFNSLTLEESYDFSCVENIKITVVDSCFDDLNGKTFEYNPHSKACFIMRCLFSKCFGPLKGFRFTNEIRDAVRNRLTSSTFKVSCGGYGDRGLQYHCDNWVELQALIRYKEQN